MLARDWYYNERRQLGLDSAVASIYDRHDDSDIRARAALTMLGLQRGWRLAEAFRARVIDATTESFVFEITGNSAKINQFIDLMRPLGLVEVSRTGVAAIGRGPEGM